MSNNQVTQSKGYKYVIEHMEEDDENTKALPEWVKLEYSHMLKLVGKESSVHFTSLSLNSIPSLKNHLSKDKSITTATSSSISKIEEKGNPTNLTILELIKKLNINFEKVCLLDPKAEKILSIEDSKKFEIFLYGGILGDDPPKDRTSELRKFNFNSRHLGEIQMTTDTAVGVTKLIIEDQIPLDKIPFVDLPTITFNKHESIEMPFRYVTDDKGEPILPPGMKEHLKADLNRSIDDF